MAQAIFCQNWLSILTITTFQATFTLLTPFDQDIFGNFVKMTEAVFEPSFLLCLLGTPVIGCCFTSSTTKFLVKNIENKNGKFVKFAIYYKSRL